MMPSWDATGMGRSGMGKWGFRSQQQRPGEQRQESLSSQPLVTRPWHIWHTGEFDDIVLVLAPACAPPWRTLISEPPIPASQVPSTDTARLSAFPLLSLALTHAQLVSVLWLSLGPWHDCSYAAKLRQPCPCLYDIRVLVCTFFRVVLGHNIRDARVSSASHAMSHNHASSLRQGASNPGVRGGVP